MENKKIVKPDFKKLWKMFPVLTGLRTLCCKQLIGTTSFKNTQTKCKCNIFHNINCKSNINYLSTTNYLCKSQLVGKSRGTFDIYLNSDKKMLKMQVLEWQIKILLYQATNSTQMQNLFLLKI